MPPGCLQQTGASAVNRWPDGSLCCPAEGRGSGDSPVLRPAPSFLHKAAWLAR